jgi:hypothetical protein
MEKQTMDNTSTRRAAFMVLGTDDMMSDILQMYR